MSYKPVCFYDEGYCIRIIKGEKERMECYRLRHLVFCETMGWLPSNSSGLEIDQYDKWATLLGIFTSQGSLVGTMRLLPANRPFMLENDFAELIPAEHQIRKDDKTAEVSRFMMAPNWKSQGLSILHTLLLMKGLYRWSLVNGIQYVYAVIEKRFWRMLFLIGFPWRPIGLIKAIPPGNIESVPVMLDCEEFRSHRQADNPEFLKWISEAQSTPTTLPAQRYDFDWRRRVLRRCSEYETSLFVR